MKRRTKITVFIASMALTFGSLMAIVGPRHCGHRMYGHHGGDCENHRTHGGWQHNACEKDSTDL